MIRELITITESSGEVEHTFFETVRDAQTDQEILENLFGELDLEESKENLRNGFWNGYCNGFCNGFCNNVSKRLF